MASQVSGLISDVTIGSNTRQVASKAYGLCETAAGTAAKTVEMTGFDITKALGVTIHVKFTNTNTVANPTLNVNSQGAKAIMRFGTTAPGTSVSGSWAAGSVVSFTYDGTYWQMNDYSMYDTDTDTKVTQTVTTTSANYEVLFSGTADNTTHTEGARKNNNLLFNPNTNSLTVGNAGAHLTYNANTLSLDFSFG